MKLISLALAVSGLASSASLGAQVALPLRTGVVAQQGTDCTYARTTSRVGDIRDLPGERLDFLGEGLQAVAANVNSGDGVTIFGQAKCEGPAEARPAGFQ